MNKLTIKLIALLCGIIFGLGLSMSGMTDTAKVIGFLDVVGRWDASLAFVMGTAVLVTFIGFRLVLSKSKPNLEDQFYLPNNTKIDRPLILGAICFGAGWGLYGYCPGPAIAALAYQHLDNLIFVVAMIAGMIISSRIKSN